MGSVNGVLSLDEVDVGAAAESDVVLLDLVALDAGADVVVEELSSPAASFVGCAPPCCLATSGLCLTRPSSRVKSVTETSEGASLAISGVCSIEGTLAGAATASGTIRRVCIG